MAHDVRRTEADRRARGHGRSARRARNGRVELVAAQRGVCDTCHRPVALHASPTSAAGWHRESVRAYVVVRSQANILPVGRRSTVCDEGGEGVMRGDETRGERKRGHREERLQHCQVEGNRLRD